MQGMPPAQTKDPRQRKRWNGTENQTTRFIPETENKIRPERLEVRLRSWEQTGLLWVWLLNQSANNECRHKPAGSSHSNSHEHAEGSESSAFWF